MRSPVFLAFVSVFVLLIAFLPPLLWQQRNSFMYFQPVYDEDYETNPIFIGHHEGFRDPVKHRHKVLLRDVVIDTENERTLQPHENAVNEDAVNEDAGMFLIHTLPHLSSEQMLELEHDLKATIVHYIPHNSWVVQCHEKYALEAQRSRAYVIWVSRYKKSFKLSDRLNEFAASNHQPDEWKLLQIALVRSTTRSKFSTRAMAESWRFAVSKELGINTAVREYGPYTVVMEVLSEGVVESSPKVSIAHVAEWIASHSVDVIRIDVSDSFEFQNFWSSGIIQNGFPDYEKANQFVLDIHDLRGSGQVVGLADSGVNLNSCFFKDDKGHVSFEEARSSLPSQLPESSHRKISRYVKGVIGDEEDQIGHGTHVAASICGAIKPVDATLTQFDGIARDAKLAFYDIKDANHKAFVPQTSLEEFFDFAYYAKARVHANPWGTQAKSPSASYSLTTQSVDKYLNERQSFVAVFAAGNYGEDNQRHSIATPGTAKNCITVGSSLSSSASFEAIFCKGGINPDEKLCKFKKRDVYPDMVVFSSSIGPTFDGRIKPDVVVPSVYIASASAAKCSRSLQSDTAVNAGTSMASGLLAGSIAVLRQYFMEGFYSEDPTRQGRRETNQGFEPSGPLLKAVVINGAFHISKRFLKTGKMMKLPDSPNVVEGFGRFQMNRAVVFEDSALYHKIFILGNKAGVDPVLEKAKEVHEYTLCVSHVYRYHPPRFSLVWYDPPAELAASHLLVNDLDIEVQAKADGKTQTFHPNGLSGRDTINTVERVVVKTKKPVQPNVELRVIVKATHLPKPPQSYAIVASGRIVFSTCQEEFPHGKVPDDRYKDLSPDKSSVMGLAVMAVLLILLASIILTISWCIYRRLRKMSEVQEPQEERREFPSMVPND